MQANTVSKTICNRGFEIELNVTEKLNHNVNVVAIAKRAGNVIAFGEVNGKLGVIGLFFPFMDSSVKELIKIATDKAVAMATQSIKDSVKKA